MSLTQDDLLFLETVRNYCKKKPELINHIVQYSVQGAIDKANEMQAMAGDMETVAAAMCAMLEAKRLTPQLKKQMSELALSKMSKYHPKKTFLNWSSSIINTEDK